MSTNLFAACTIASLLCACSAPPKLAMPDGRTRSLANSEAAIAAYMSSLAKEQASAREDTHMSRQLDTVKRDIANLRTDLSAVAILTEDSRKKDVRTISAPTMPALPISAKPNQSPTDMTPPVETVRVGDQSITFRTNLAVGISEFRPSAWFEQALLKAAKNGERIEIRAGTDGTVPGPGNENVAKARAMNARDYLVANGIMGDKIRATFFAAGGFVADNSTPQGKVQNRRIDIEVMPVEPASAPEKEKQQTGATR